MSGQARSWLTLSAAMWRGFTRDRVSQFFYFLFPLMFLVLFGLLLGNPDAGRITVGVVGEGDLVAALPDEVFETRSYDDFDDAVAAVEDGDIPAAVRQRGDVVELRFSAANRVAAGTAHGVLQSIVGEANLAAAAAPSRYELDSAQVEDTSFEPIQFLTSGMLAWGVAMGAAFGASLNLVTWRRTQLLRRLRLSPVSSLSVVGARVGVSLAIALLQGAVFIGVAATPPFGLQLGAGAWLIVPYLVLGTLAFMSIGLLVGSLVKTEEAASGAVNLIVLPMSFLSGVFFEPGALPGWLQALSWTFPLKHMSAGMLDVLIREPEAGQVALHLGVLAGTTLLLGGLAARFFTWED